MQYRQHHFKSTLVLLLVHVDRDTTSVVDHRYRIVGVDGDVNPVGISGQRFIYGVVHDLIHKVMKSLDAYVADVHCRALAHGLQAFEDLNVTGAVFLFLF